MKIFIVRHGNTFGADQAGGERIIMCGSQENIPLVQKGREQARMMAQYLNHINIIPTALYANHLIRVWEHAVLIQEYFYYHRQVTIPIHLDERLIELDYGRWAGLTIKGSEGNQVITQFGREAWDDWQLRRIIPKGSLYDWKVTHEEVITNVRSFFDGLTARHQSNDVIIVIGSQGSLGFVNTLFEGGMKLAIAENHFKMKTGNFSEIAYDKRVFKLISWDQNPQQMIER